MNKAPKGGLVSKVNGQFYNGGEFTPEHGLYCGLGKAKVKNEVVEKVNATLAMDGKRVEWNEKNQCWTILRMTTFADGTVAEMVMFNIYTAASLKKLIEA